MVYWYVVAECQWLGPNFGQSEYIHMDGYDERTMGSQHIQSDSDPGDPFLSYGIDTETWTFGQAQMEIGLIGSHRIRINSSGVQIWTAGDVWKDPLTEGGGAEGEWFKTITGITNDVVADVSDDTLTISSANNRLTIVGNSETDTINFTLVEANIDHNALANLNAGDSYEHITQAQKDALHNIYTNAEAVSAVIAENPLTLTNDLTVGGGNIISANGLWTALTGAPNGYIWAISGQYPNYGLYYHTGTPDYMEWHWAGVVKAKMNMETGDLTVANLITAGNVDGVDVSSFKTVYDAHLHDGDTLQLDGINSDGGVFNIATSLNINFKPDADADDYITFTTVAGVPYISFVGGNGRITAVADPTNNQDVATKKFHNDNKTVAGDLNLNDLAEKNHASLTNKNAEDNVKHLTDAQVTALHNIYTNAEAVQAVEDAGLVLSASKSINIDGTPADVTYTGIVLDIDTTGCSTYHAVYIDGVNSVLPAKADSIGTMPCIGIVVAAGKVLVLGVVRSAAGFNLLADKVVYVDEDSAGLIKDEIPDSIGDIVQTVGYTVGVDMLYVNPSIIWAVRK